MIPVRSTCFHMHVGGMHAHSRRNRDRQIPLEVIHTSSAATRMAEQHSPISGPLGLSLAQGPPVNAAAIIP